MKAEFINPFIESLGEIFQSMLAVTITRGEIGLTDDAFEPGSLIAIIGISGPITGTVALSLPSATALKAIGTLLGAELTKVDDQVTDGVAELVNMVAGGAKAKLTDPDSDEVAHLSLPTVIFGEEYCVKYPTSSAWLHVPFTSDYGDLSLRVTMES